MKVGGVVVFDDYYTWPSIEEEQNEIGCQNLIMDIMIHTDYCVTFLGPVDIDPNSTHKIRMVRVDIR